MVASASYWTAASQLAAIQKAFADAKARGAQSLTTHDTTGTGTSVPGSPFSFGVSFLHEPAILSGFVVTRAPGAGWQLPRVSAGVYRWVRDSRGLFTAAYLYFAVDCPPVDSTDVPAQPANPAVTHHLVFAGNAFHDLSGSTDSYLAAGTALDAMVGGTA